MTREVSISTRTAMDDLVSEEKVLKEEKADLRGWVC